MLPKQKEKVRYCRRKFVTNVETFLVIYIAYISLAFSKCIVTLSSLPKHQWLRYGTFGTELERCFHSCTLVINYTARPAL